MNRDFDYIIVGQGIAGSILHFELSRRGANVLVIDDHHQSSASKVGAGVVTPLTGRKYVKSWLIDDLIPAAKESYETLSKMLGTPLYREINVVRALHSVKEENEWFLKANIDQNKHYVVMPSDIGAYQNIVREPLEYGELKALQVYMPNLIHYYRQLLIQTDLFYQDHFVFDELKLGERVEYNGMTADKIIFAEGYKVKSNPFFSHLSMEPAKGEALLIKIDNPDELIFNKILKLKLNIVPLDQNVFWVGSGYQWDFEDQLPTKKEEGRLRDILDQQLKCKYEVLHHLAAIRPTNMDRRPYIGAHYEYPELMVFNGFGTKGASLVPHWAKALSNYLIDGVALSDEVDPNR